MSMNTIRSWSTSCIVLVVVGVILGLINRYIPMAGGIKSLLNGVIIIVMLIYVLQVFGIIGASAASTSKTFNQSCFEVWTCPAASAIDAPFGFSRQGKPSTYSELPQAITAATEYPARPGAARQPALRQQLIDGGNQRARPVHRVDRRVRARVRAGVVPVQLYDQQRWPLGAQTLPPSAGGAALRWSRTARPGGRRTQAPRPGR